MMSSHTTSLASAPVFRHVKGPDKESSEEDLREAGVKPLRTYIVSWVSATSKNEGYRAEKIVNDSGFDSGSGKYQDSYNRLPGSGSCPISKESAPLVKISLSMSRFHFPHFILLAW